MHLDDDRGGQIASSPSPGLGRSRGVTPRGEPRRGRPAARRTFLLALLGAVVAVTGCGSSSSKKTTSAAASTPASTSAPATPKAAGARVRVRHTSLGRIIVDGRGHTLYMFAADRSGKSTCTGTCAKFWPPYTTSSKPTAGPGVKASLLGTTPGAGGTSVVTYHGHPLYGFLKDKKAGQTTGEDATAFGARWDALSPAGTRVTKPKPKPKPATSSSTASTPVTTHATTTPPPTTTHATTTHATTTPPPVTTHAAPPPPPVTTHAAPPPPTTTHKSTPPPSQGGGIPQGGGGDGDGDNSGGPSDGDGAI